MKRSQLANIAFYVQSIAEIVILAVIVGIMFGVRVDASEANNNWGLSVLIAFATGCGWWFHCRGFFSRREGRGRIRGGISLLLVWGSFIMLDDRYGS